MPLTVWRGGARLRDRAVLLRRTRSPSVRAGSGATGPDRVARRGRGGDRRDRRRVGVSKPTVIRWKRRYAAEGVGGLEDQPKSGQPPTVDRGRDESCWPRCEPPPERLGVTHWSTRLLAERAGHQQLQRVARRGRCGASSRTGWETFKFSTDPELEAKIRDVVGLYLRPAGEGGGALRGREVPDPGPGPDRADPAAAPRAAGVPDPRLRPARHHHPVRRPGGGHRARSSTPATSGTATRSSCVSSSRSPRPTRG